MFYEKRYTDAKITTSDISVGDARTLNYQIIATKIITEFGT